MTAAVGLALSTAATWYLSVVSQRLDRRFRDRLAIAMEAHIAHLQATRRDDRAPGAPGLPRPAGRAAQPGVRPGPPVLVAAEQRRLRVPPGRHGGAAGVDPPGAPAAAAGRAPGRAHVAVATGRRAQRRGVGGRPRPPGPPPVRRRHHGRRGEGGPRHRHRRRAAVAPPRGASGVAGPDGLGPLGVGAVGVGGVGDLRHRLRPGHRLGRPGHRPERRQHRARRRRRAAPVAVHRPDRRRARLPPRRVAGLVVAADVAGGLRRRVCAGRPRPSRRTG